LFGGKNDNIHEGLRTVITRIYQFADIPLTLANQAVFPNQDTQWAGGVGTYTHNYKFYGIGQRYINQPTELTFSGRMIFDGTFLPGRLEQKLRSYVGLRDALICYVLPNDYPAQLDLCESCSDCCKCEIIWVNAPAILSSVNVDRSDYEAGFTISLTFKLLNLFSPLNPYLWAFDGNIAPDLTEAANVGGNTRLYCLPTCEEMFSKTCIGCNFFSKRNFDEFNFVFSGAVWAYLKASTCCTYDYMSTPGFNPDGAGFYGYFRGFTLPRDDMAVTNVINIDPDIWGGLPSSIYKIQFFDAVFHTPIVISGGAGQILTITNEYREGTLIKYNFVTIDLVDLQAQVIAQTGVALRDSDAIYVGDFNYYDIGSDSFYRGAMLTRDGAIVRFVHPKIEFDSFSPGQLFPTHNTVRFTVNSGYVAGDYELIYNYIHWYRRV